MLHDPTHRYTRVCISQRDVSEHKLGSCINSKKNRENLSHNLPHDTMQGARMSHLVHFLCNRTPTTDAPRSNLDCHTTHRWMGRGRSHHVTFIMCRGIVTNSSSHSSTPRFKHPLSAHGGDVDGVALRPSDQIISKMDGRGKRRSATPMAACSCSGFL